MLAKFDKSPYMYATSDDKVDSLYSLTRFPPPPIV